MFWLGLFLPLVYIPGFTDLDILSGWIMLSLFLPFFFLRPLRMGPAHWLGLAFLAYAFASVLWTPIWQQAIWDLWLFSILAACFCLGERDDLRSLYTGLAAGIGINAFLALLQTFGWEGVHHNNSDYPAGLFFNPDMLGESAVVVTIALYAVRRYWLIALTLPAVFLSHSRAAIAALAVVVVWELWSRYTWKALLVVAVVVAGIAYDPTHRSAVASFDERKALWLDTVDGLSPFGHGAGSFFMLYPKYASRTDTMLTRPEDPHNDYLNLAFEYGLGALPVVAILVIGGLAGDPQRSVLLAFCVIAFFSFPIRIPIEGLVGMVALGRCCRTSPLDGWLRVSWRQIRAGWRLYTGSQSVPLEPLHPYKSGIRGS